jgi:hypothetical protein
MSQRTRCILCLVLLLLGLQWVVVEPPVIGLQLVRTAPPLHSHGHWLLPHAEFALQTDSIRHAGLAELGRLLLSVYTDNPRSPEASSRIPRSPPAA